MSVTIMRGDARSLALADDSVDLIVTSPPYFGLRSYQDGGEHYAGQLGDEATPAEFVDALIACTAEWTRVLKPSGSMWVNLGDKYAGSGPGFPHNGSATVAQPTQSRNRAGGQGRMPVTAVRAKSLIGIPWRYALRCIDDLGLILRAEVIWSKPNGLPESVTDRVRRSHEQWFHFTLEPRYFSAVDEIREAATTTVTASGGTRYLRPGETPSNGRQTRTGDVNPDRADGGMPGFSGNPLGKLPGSVWTVPTEPLRVPASLGIDHFAAFPSEWPKRIIAGWSPSGVCVECGEGRRPVSYNDPLPHQAIYNGKREGIGGQNGMRSGVPSHPRWTIVGYACACPEPTADTTPAVVLHPFGGTGTTAMVAHALGRHGISNDMSADYCRLATWRTSDPGQIAKVRGERKPEPPRPSTHLSFLDETEAL